MRSDPSINEYVNFSEIGLFGCDIDGNEQLLTYNSPRPLLVFNGPLCLANELHIFHGLYLRRTIN